ncbi:Putative NADH:flavin oxidoreductase/NADH oxidase, aldolase-type TIM barrel, oxidoreductase Oye [Colletotrichum destructivum]|uniref:NADH:flavin oxidoreductase/NADH oxidase, aldolase-type TIM barrel, oxidoreductase Oye n=1 Tax=Colletotrichum destructivum TaxID=34406 RepID=A0AAX4IMQ9_9PEZI|nr:Putative NADH:flavin oxidoreductase/NADH oxidase, aldolase-type TIM barrel, oxidoreductase Oye [Colletotrichum destructivum]
MSSLLEPAVVGGKLELRNRVVMGSMTRNRCIDNKPGQPQVRHYADRAADGTGLIVVEGIFVDWSGCDWSFSPVMITEEHSKAWQQVVNAVHDKGGKIFFQAWHCGRCQHDQMPMMKERNHPVLAPSKIKAKAGKYRDLPGTPGHTDNITEIENPSDVIETYRHSAKLAKRSGFDGVELLAQGGYLPQQFLNSRANKRTDAYGGTVENRCRFILELVDALSEVFGGPEFVCVKLCPSDDANDSEVTYEEMKEVYTFLLRSLVARRIGIINLSRRGTVTKGTEDFFSRHDRPEDFPLPAGYDPVLDFGPLVKFPGSPSLLMANHDYTVEEANQLVTEGKLDLITFGRPFIYNPDVISRIKNGIPFAQNTRGKAVHYGPYSDPNENYNDWPAALTQ